MEKRQLKEVFFSLKGVEKYVFMIFTFHSRKSYCFFLFLVLVVLGCGKKEQREMKNNSKPIIGLITDFSSKDPYVAQMKGVIFSLDPDARVIDLNHEIDPFNLTEAAFIVDQSSREFPPGSIFIAVIDPGVGTDRKAILWESKAHKFYIGPDNGIFSLVMDREGITNVWILDKPEMWKSKEPSSTFHGRDVFSPIAAFLSKGGKPQNVGSKISKDNLHFLSFSPASIIGQNISAQVLYVDHYGNIITNIPWGLAPWIKEGNLVRVQIGKITLAAPCVRTYSELPLGKIGVLYNSSGYLEIASNQGSAAKLFKVQSGASLLIHP
ncbi:SAM-dependent chlorinase/fluorinase [Candidatus Methylacidiphilum infernorum]|uniref:SAM-dependent chlorinase/fluorinase n=2 Tax=Candidatus Methylacidiphilum infernorum TaxID=511746 RepID=A0ABX7PVM7_9BACT|nr:SAM-dependent chlorinase/fluorinase [Candidatus Methylacidiphilum infernorum]